MTLAAPTYPLDLPSALQHLRDALGENYSAATDDATLTRALGVDAVYVGASASTSEQVHARPWATAHRLISDNTEYELDKGLKARIDRKLAGLVRQQASADSAAGISELVASLVEAQTSAAPHSGSVSTRAVY